MTEISVVIYAILCLTLGTTPSHSFEKYQKMEQKVVTQPSQDKAEWRAATYKGLTIGISTSADMLRVLGKPHWSGSPQGQTEDNPNPEVWNDYKIGGKLSGKLTVVVDKSSGTINSIDLYPENLSKEEAIKHFGENYIITRYAFDECLGDEESSPVYESPDGPLISIEYRERGIALSVDEQSTVTRISYVKEPLGTTESKCKPAGQPVRALDESGV